MDIESKDWIKAKTFVRGAVYTSLAHNLWRYEMRGDVLLARRIEKNSYGFLVEYCTKWYFDNKDKWLVTEEAVKAIDEFVTSILVNIEKNYKEKPDEYLSGCLE